MYERTPFKAASDECFGLVRPRLDAHTLGIASVQTILEDCGYRTVIADAPICTAFETPELETNIEIIRRWISEYRITVLGFSFRLAPESGAVLFARWVEQLKSRKLLAPMGGPLRALFFAGLPQACDWVRQRIPEIQGVFRGDETPAETLGILGVDPQLIPREMAKSVTYDEDRLSFGQDLIAKGDYRTVRSVDRTAYHEFGTAQDTLLARLGHGNEHRLPPLMRAHVGPYLPDRTEAVRLFLDWTRTLATSGFLDVLSIGTSQLTQSRFGQEWGDSPNGGGVPLNTPAEFAAVWQAARPMLVRTYAGTQDLPALARMYEQTINMAWHALSFWWFCRIDGRGPYSVRENLEQHLKTLRFVAEKGKPLEPNVPHHFAFRGADDVTYVVSAFLAAKTAKRFGIRHLILQNMLNTPKATWGVQDLAKSRAMLRLVRELQDEHFHVILQPRAGLDFFAPDLEKAKAQLAAVSVLMDDIEPRDETSPPIIHVVSYCEASHLADPATVQESIQITRHAIEQHRRLRARGHVDDMTGQPEVVCRTEALVNEARTVIRAVESVIADPYTADGLYKVFEEGFLPVPYLWECRDEFRNAIQWQTRVIHGSVKIVDEQGKPIPAVDRMRRLTKREQSL